MERNFKVGDTVKVVKLSRAMAGFSVGDKVKIIRIDDEDTDLKYCIENDEFIGWASEDSIEFMNFKFEVGDMVKINKNATIDDFVKDCWGGCKNDTLKFLFDHADSKEEFTIEKVSSKGNLIFKKFNWLTVNKNIFELVKRKEEVHNRMTVREIEEMLGITGLEIVKEDK